MVVQRRNRLRRRAPRCEELLCSLCFTLAACEAGSKKIVLIALPVKN